MRAMSIWVWQPTGPKVLQMDSSLQRESLVLARVKGLVNHRDQEDPRSVRSFELEVKRLEAECNRGITGLPQRMGPLNIAPWDETIKHAILNRGAPVGGPVKVRFMILKRML